MTEEFLHYIWKYKHFNQNNLCSENGAKIIIDNEGTYNLGAGPDFNNSKIFIQDITWVGNVEIHINSSDWYIHGHQNDPVYSKTILHVVWNHDKPVYDLNNNEIPVLVLKGRVSATLLANFKSLQFGQNKIMCAGLTSTLNPFETFQWLNRLLVERLERKVIEIKSLFEQTNNDWEQTFFIVLSKNMGFKINELPMTLLAKSIGFKTILKNQDKPIVIESIFYGVAGLLSKRPTDSYMKRLTEEFKHQKVKYGLEELDHSMWKFGRIRPSNFSSLRISQLVNLIHTRGNLFHFLIRDFNLNIDLKTLNIETSKYWETHYVFGKESKEKVKRLGSNSVENIMINTIAPMLFFYGKETLSSKHEEMAIDLLDKLPHEKNYIVRNWNQNNIFAKNASDSQSLIELTNNYCVLKKCLNCGIGIQILKNGPN